MTPSEQEQVASGLRIAGLMPELEFEIDRQKKLTISKARQLQLDGKLDGPMAIALWLEMDSLDRILSAFRSRVLSAETVGKRSSISPIGVATSYNPYKRMNPNA